MFELASLKDSHRGLPWWPSGKESTCQSRRHKFDPWSGKIPYAEEKLSLRSAARGAAAVRSLSTTSWSVAPAPYSERKGRAAVKTQCNQTKFKNFFKSSIVAK